MGKYQELPESLREIDIECWSGVGEGWWPIVRTLDHVLRYVDPDYTIDQVKEKFGGLRFYYTTRKEGAREKMAPCVSFAQGLSYTVCETCGKPGKLIEDGWWRTTTTCGEHTKS